MNIVSAKYGIDFAIGENEIGVITIENPEAFACFTENLWKQSLGEDGELILSSNNKELKIDKSVSVVFNPFSIDLNEKRVITKLYQELKELLLNYSFEKIEKLNSRIIGILDDLAAASQYDVTFELELDIIGLLKLYKVGIQTDVEPLVERIIEYMKVMNRICGIRHMIFLNLKSYISSEDLMELYKSCLYEKVTLLIVEAFSLGKNQNEKHLIIDKDLCIIQDF